MCLKETKIVKILECLNCSFKSPNNGIRHTNPMSVELNSMSDAKTRAPAWITASVAPLFRNLCFRDYTERESNDTGFICSLATTDENKSLLWTLISKM